jgi:hypothetical protein
VSDSPAPLVSILLPTRGRPEALTRSVESLREKAGDADSIQICYAVDADDEAAAETVSELKVRDDCVSYFPRHGYGNLHLYVNEVAQLGRGTWLMLWNDDAIMQSYGWDWRIAEFKPRYVLDCWTNHPPLTCTFPIVPAAWVQALGHFSLNAHCDSWWQYLGEWTHRLVRADIDVLHERYDLTGSNNDETYQQGWQEHQTDEFYNRRNVDLIKADAKVVMGLLEQQRTRRLKGMAEWE